MSTGLQFQNDESFLFVKGSFALYCRYCRYADQHHDLCQLDCSFKMMRASCLYRGALLYNGNYGWKPEVLHVMIRSPSRYNLSLKWKFPFDDHGN